MTTSYHMNRRRNIQDLTPSDIGRILELAPDRCYVEIAEEYDVPTHTIRRIVRCGNQTRLKRYG